MESILFLLKFSDDSTSTKFQIANSNASTFITYFWFCTPSLRGYSIVGMAAVWMRPLNEDNRIVRLPDLQCVFGLCHYFSCVVSWPSSIFFQAHVIILSFVISYKPHRRIMPFIVYDLLPSDCIQAPKEGKAYHLTDLLAYWYIDLLFIAFISVWCNSNWEFENVLYEYEYVQYCSRLSLALSLLSRALE